MHLTIHRGSHEIGGSCVELESDGSRIIIDLGIPLVHADGSRFNITEYHDQHTDELISKGVLPNIKGLYYSDNESDPLDGLFISHSHIDHYGLLGYIGKNVPVHVGKASFDLIRITSLFSPEYSKLSCASNNCIFYENRKQLTCGKFKVTPFLMDHSGFDSYAFLIESKGKRVVYSGDFRNHGRKKEALASFIKNVPHGCDALLLEGTMMGRESKITLTEDEITDEIIEFSKDIKGITFIYFSSQNIDRLVSFYKAAASMKKLFVVDVYTAYIMLKMKEYAKIPHPSKTFGNVKIFYGGNYLDKLPDEDKHNFIKKQSQYKITVEEIAENQNNIMMTIRGSLLNSLRKIEPFNDALFIYSMWDGYLKEISMIRILDFLKNNNIKMINVHTSGHANIDTLKYVVQSIKPKTVIPIHTFHPDHYAILEHQNVVPLSDGNSFRI